jgi:hypothetical protein
MQIIYVMHHLDLRAHDIGKQFGVFTLTQSQAAKLPHVRGILDVSYYFQYADACECS